MYHRESVLRGNWALWILFWGRTWLSDKWCPWADWSFHGSPGSFHWRYQIQLLWQGLNSQTLAIWTWRTRINRGLSEETGSPKTRVLSQQVGEVTAVPVLVCQAAEAWGKGRAAGLFPSSPPPSGKLKKKTSVPTSLSLAEALVHPPHLSLACAPTANSQGWGVSWDDAPLRKWGRG